MLLDGSATLPSGVTTSTGQPVPAGTMPANSPSPIGTPINSGTAPTVAEVAINLVVDADGTLGTNSQTSSEDLTVSDSVVLRITPVPSDYNGQPKPCE
jgi:hypothetical protein